MKTAASTESTCRWLYHKDTEPLYHSFMFSLVLLLSGILIGVFNRTLSIYPLPAMHLLLVIKTLSCPSKSNSKELNLQRTLLVFGVLD